MGFGSWIKLRTDKRKSEELKEKSKKESKTDSNKTKEKLKKIKEMPDKKMDLFQPAAEFIEDEKK